MPSLARLRPGRSVALVDLSCEGALVEADARLLPGTRVELQLGGPMGEVRVGAQVLRCEVIALQGGRSVRYRGALAFEQSLDLYV